MTDGGFRDRCNAWYAEFERRFRLLAEKEYPLARGCFLAFEGSCGYGGVHVCEAFVSDARERVYRRGTAPSVVGRFFCRTGRRLMPEAAIAAFAAKIENLQGRQTECMPEGMRRFCAEALRQACREMAAERPDGLEADGGEDCARDADVAASIARAAEKARGGSPKPLKASPRSPMEAFINAPREEKTPEACRKAVSGNGMMLLGVPEELRTAELCALAVEGEPMALEFVPEALKTPEMCMACVSRRGLALRSVPESMRTREVCMAAMAENPFAMPAVPEGMADAEFCAEAVKRNPYALQTVPRQFRTVRMCRDAVAHDPRLKIFVPSALRAAMEAAEMGAAAGAAGYGGEESDEEREDR